ncbi:MAG: hypothetical protein AAF383_09105 [Cyanobacteria bacterium P01_A01_bin.83]
MSSGKSIATKAQEQRKFVTVIHPERLNTIAPESESTTSLDREAFVSWLFLVGSLMFLVDGFIELREGISVHALIHLVASILFVVGSVLFIPTGKKS